MGGIGAGPLLNRAFRSRCVDRALHTTPVLGRLSNYREWHPNKKWTDRRDLKHPAPEIDESAVRPGTQWSPPQGGFEHLPFRVFRTEARQLPVYNRRLGNGHYKTILRRYRGDVRELVKEMSKVCDERKVIIHAGYLEVHGLYRQNLISWLKRLGF